MLPDVPTALERGFANMEADTWTAFFLPKGTPQPIADKLHAATLQTIETPAVKAQLEKLGATLVAPERRSPAYLAEFVKADVAKWAAAVKASGIEPQ